MKNQSQQVKIITLFKDKFESCLGLVIPLELTSLVVYLTRFRLGSDLLSESKDLLFHIGNGLFLRRAFCLKFGMCLIDLSLVAVRDGGASRIEGVLLMDTWRLIAESPSLFPRDLRTFLLLSLLSSDLTGVHHFLVLLCDCLSDLIDVDLRRF